MEHEGGYSPEEAEQFVAPVTNVEGGTEQEQISAMDRLPAELGFKQTEEMLRLEESLVTALREGHEGSGALFSQWVELADQLISADSANTQVAQIGRLVADALIYRNAGMVEAYKDQLGDIATYAENTPGMERVLEIIGSELK